MTTASSYSALVQELYVAYFGRPADAGGLTNFENALLAAGAPTSITSLAEDYATNIAIQDLINSFGNSAESQKLYGTVTASLSSAEAFVTAVFEHVLNRAPASAGLQFWANAIATGSLSVGNAALAIAEGAQTNTTTQGLLDAQTVANKLAVAAEFTAAVASPTGIDEYQGSGAANVGRALLAGVSNTTVPTAYLPTVESAVLSLATARTSYTLTTGVDDLIATGNNNLFNAVLDNAAGAAAGGSPATLNTGDTVVGGPGVNALAIQDEGISSTLAMPTGITLTNITNLNITSSEGLGTQDFSSWAGLTSVNITASNGQDTLKVGNQTSLALTDTGLSVAIQTSGGSSVAVTTDAANAVTVYGGTSTTTVTVKGGDVILIEDANFGTSNANSITSAAITSPAGTTKIESAALQSLSITSDTGEAVTVYGSASAPQNLTLTLDEVANGALQADDATTIDVDAVTAASSGIQLSSTGATALHIDADVGLTVSSVSAAHVTSATVAGAGALTGNLTGLGGNATVDATTSTGAIDMTLAAGQSFTGGSGADTLTIGTQSINLSSGAGITITPGSAGGEIVSAAAGVTGTIVFGTHTVADVVNVVANGSAANLGHILTLTGLNSGATDISEDAIGFSGSISSVSEVTPLEIQEAVGFNPNGYTLAQYIATATGKGGQITQNAHGVVWFEYDNNTYLVYTASNGDNGTLSSADTVVELTGQNYSFVSVSISGSQLSLNAGGTGNGVDTLTTGVDTLTGSAFDAILDNAAGMAAGFPASTLNAGDTLTGTGYSTLNITDYGLNGYTNIPAGATLSGLGTVNITSSEAVAGGADTNANFDNLSGLTNLNILASTGNDNITAGQYLISIKVVEAGQSVSVTSNGIVDISDANFSSGGTNTISSVNLTSPANGDMVAMIYSDALSTLSITGTIYATIFGSAPTLTVNIDDSSSQQITDSYSSTMIVNAIGQKSYEPINSNTITTFVFNDSVDFQTAISDTSVTSLTITGAGAFSASLYLGNTSSATIDATHSTGSITLDMNPGESFAGGQGQDTLYLPSGHYGTITGSSASGNEIVLESFGAITQASLPTASDFSVLGLQGTWGTFDFNQLPGYNELDIKSSTGAVTLANAQSSDLLNIDGEVSGALTWQAGDSNGASDTATVTLGNGYQGGEDFTLNLLDAGSNGIGTLNLATNDVAGVGSTVIVLNDPGLSTLHLTGSEPVYLSMSDQTASAITVSDTIPFVQYVGGAEMHLTDSNLASFTFNGSGSMVVDQLTSDASTFTASDSLGGTLDLSLNSTSITSYTLTNADIDAAATFNIELIDGAAQTLNLNGNVGVTLYGDSYTGGFTISGATDNANVSFDGTGPTAAGATNTIRLGNGNDSIGIEAGSSSSSDTITLGTGTNTVIDQSSGAVTLTVTGAAGVTEYLTVYGTSDTIVAGNGNNIIDAAGQGGTITVGSGTNTIETGVGAAFNITIGAHTTADTVAVGGLNSPEDLTKIDTIAGLNNAGQDAILFNDAFLNIAGNGVVQITDANVLAASGSDATLADWVAAALGAGGVVPQIAHSLLFFQFQGNTYLVDTGSGSAAGVLSTSDTVVELVGTNYTFAHATFSAGATSGAWLHLNG